MSNKLAGGCKASATSVSLPLEIRKAADGTAFTGLVYNTSGLTAAYWRQGGSPVSITLASLSGPSNSWGSGGFCEVSSSSNPGVYRLDVPDAAFATGADWVQVSIVLAGASPCNFMYALETKGCSDLNDIAATAIVSAGAITTSGGKVAGVALVDTLTTYTGNTIQTGDAFALIGTGGAGLTALGDTRIAFLDASVNSRSTFAGGPVASVTGAVGSVTADVSVGTNNDKTGYALTTDYDAAKTAAADGTVSALNTSLTGAINDLNSSTTSGLGGISTELTTLSTNFDSFNSDFTTFSTTILADMEALTDSIVPTITSPLTLNGSDMTIFRGSDYAASNSTAVVFTLAAGPDLTGGTVTLLLYASNGVISVSGTVVAARQVSFNLSAMQTTGMQNTARQNGQYEVHAVVSAKTLPVQARGRLAVIQPLHI